MIFLKSEVMEMTDIFEDRVVMDLSDRINELMIDSKAKWGKFNVSKMICHLQDNLRYPLGLSEEVKDLIKGPPLFARTLVRLYLPWPKNSPTGLNMLETQPVEIEKDKIKTIELLNQFKLNKDLEKWPFHPFFGKLDGVSWAKLLYRHLDYHLKQFRV